MKKITNLKYLILYTIILIVALTSKVQASTGIVSTETLNMRSGPSTNSSIVKLLNEGEKIEIISEEGNWYKIKSGEKEGYVSKDFVQVNDDSVAVEKPDDTSKEKPVEETPNPTEKPIDEIPSSTTIKLEENVTIRILPLINSHIIGTANAGDEITIISTANNWMFIEKDNITGWIVKDQTIGQNIKENPEKNGEENVGESQNTEKTKNKETKAEETENKIEETNADENSYETNVTKYVNASSVYLRAKPSTDSDIVTSLIRNTDVTVIGESGNWYKVKFDKYNGYIHKDLLTDKKTEQTNRGNSNREQLNEVSNIGTEIVEYAKKYLGCPYVYGGAGSTSFDCSGFTQYVYKNFGYSLSHSAIAQSKVGQYVAKEDLRLGDLVFFLDYETMDGIGHCGIYIGDGNFIHASSGTGYCVKISTLLSGSYNTRYATARRLI